LKDPGDSTPPWAPGFRYLTADEAPIPLRFKKEPEHFIVEEIPTLEHDGDGEHLYLFIEKRSLSTSEAARRIARALDVDHRGVGWAGRKDARAVTRQWFSVRGAPSDRALAIEGPDIHLLRHTRHRRKLRVGALAGNRFELRLVEIATVDRPRVERSLALLERKGLPNYFGAQRFGYHGCGFELGRLLVARRYAEFIRFMAGPDQSRDTSAVFALREGLAHDGGAPHRKLRELVGHLPSDLASIARQLSRRPGDFESAVRALDRRTPRLFLSALQARVFNRVLAARLDTFDCPQRGDLVQLHPGRSLFPVDETEDLELLRERAVCFELSPTGPIPGWKAPRPTGDPGELEQSALVAEGLREDSFRHVLPGVDLPGSRRPLRVPIRELSYEWSEEGDLLITFILPPGAYATSLIEELRKKE
jgi:tRNA pseudouridine13 synthase